MPQMLNMERRTAHYGRVAYLIATMLAKQYNINIVWGKGGTPHCNSNNTIYLPMFTIEDDDAATLLHGFIDHEASHAALTDWKYVPKINKTPLLHAVWNVLEDIRIEKTMGARYPGMPKNLKQTVGILVKKGFIPEPKADATPAEAMQQYMLCRLRNNVLGQSALTAYADRAEEILKKTVSAGVAVRLQALMFEVTQCQSTKDTTLLAKRVMEMLEEEAKKEQDAQQQQGQQGQQGQNSQGNNSGQAGQGQPGQGQSGQQSGQQSGGSQQQQGSGGNSSGSGGANGQQDGSQTGAGGQHTQGGNADPNNPDPQNPSGQPNQAIQEILQMTEDQVMKGLGEILKENLEQMSNQTPDGQKIIPAQESTSYTESQNATQIMDRAARPAASLMQRIAALMQAHTLGDTRIARSGRRVDSRYISRLSSGDFRIFERKSEGMEVDTAVMMLVDKSGSMSDNVGNGLTLLEVALDCAMAAGMAMDRVPGVNVSVAAFPANYGNDVVALTRFSEKIRTTARRYPSVRSSGSTPLAEAVMWCIGQLVMQPQPRKILLVLTDGAPDNRQRAQDALELAQAVKIETMGIGINHDLSHLFSDCEIVRDVSDLPRAMFGMLQRALLQQTV